MRPIFQFMSTTGDGAGTLLMNNNYASAAEEFYVENTSMYDMALHRMVVQYGDGNGWSPGEFANTGAALTNGISLSKRNSGGSVLVDITGPLPIKENHHWTRFCYDGSLDDYGTGDDYFTVRWTLSKAGVPLVLRPNERLSMILNDDLSALSSFTCNVQGVLNN